MRFDFVKANVDIGVLGGLVGGVMVWSSSIEAAFGATAPLWCPSYGVLAVCAANTFWCGAICSPKARTGEEFSDLRAFAAANALN